MNRNILTKGLAAALGTVVSIGLFTVPAGAARSPKTSCILPSPPPLVPGVDYLIVPDDLDATLISLQGALTDREIHTRAAARNAKFARANVSPLMPGVDYVVVPDDLDATLISLQGAITARDIQHRTAPLLPTC